MQRDIAIHDQGTALIQGASEAIQDATQQTCSHWNLTGTILSPAPDDKIRIEFWGTQPNRIERHHPGARLKSVDIRGRHEKQLVA
jgi:hypothetical protein